jgi:GT2 family glycosyltransferase
MCPKLSVIIVNMNTRALVCQCLDSVYANAPECEFEIIVVDNASTDGSCETVESRYPRVCLIRNSQNVGFSAANNLAFEIAQGENFLLLNSDTVVLPGSLDKLLSVFRQDATVGVVAPRLVYPDGSLQMSYGPMPNLFVSFCSFLDVKRWIPRSLVRKIGPFARSGVFGKSLRPYFKWSSPKAPPTAKLENGVFVTGACMLIRRECFQQVGSMDPAFFMYVDDADYCKRVHDAGWEIEYLSEATVVHIKGGTAGQRYRWTSPAAYYSVFYFLKKHRGRTVARVAKGFALSSLFFQLIAKAVVASPAARDRWNLLREVAVGPVTSAGANTPGGRQLEEKPGHVFD